MNTGTIILLIILAVLIILLVALYFFGKKAQKKQEEQQSQLEAVAQTVSMLVIDKKRTNRLFQNLIHQTVSIGKNIIDVAFFQRFAEEVQLIGIWHP